MPLPTQLAQPATTMVPIPQPVPMAAVAGGAVGGAAILALVVGLLVFFCRRRFAKSRSRTSFNKPPPVPMKLLGDNSLGLLVPGKGLKDSPYTGMMFFFS